MRGAKQGAETNPATGILDSLPAPTKGWNRRDPLSAMKAGFAVILDDWWPLPYSIQLRKGSLNWATGIAGATVNTLITYRPAAGTQKLFGFAGTKLFDCSATGAVGAAAVSGLTNDQWNCLNFSTTGGNYLACLNGVDKMELYDGAAWAAIDGVSAPIAITGVATTSLINLFVHKKRIYYIEKSSLKVWYPAVGAIGGALTALNFTSVFSKGGALVAGGTWSADAGDGKDDYACFLTDQGELAVYQGDNPGDPTAWSLIGVFVVGAPIGKRCLIKYGGDLLILTVDGVVSSTAAFQRGREVATQLAITDVIQGAVAESGGLYKDVYGWQMTLFSEASMFLVNVPESGAVKQWAMNTVTKAWARFRRWETTCFEIFNGSLYYGAAGAVVKAWTGASDNGATIIGEVLPAFSYFKAGGATKQFMMLRPNIEWDSNPLSIKLGFDVDYQINTPTQDIALSSSTGGSTFDSALWDTAIWSGSLTPKSEWYTVDGVGLTGAPHMTFESNVSTARITSFDVIYQKGSIFG